jgi:hypothetical protein
VLVDPSHAAQWVREDLAEVQVEDLVRLLRSLGACAHALLE